MKKHSKHAKLKRKENGFFGPNELSFVGVKCSVITDLISILGDALVDEVKIAYVDASHNKELQAPKLDIHTYHHSGDFALHANVVENKYNNPLRFSCYDLVCINGNHFQGQRQVVFLDPEKEASIEKRIDQITDVAFFIKTYKQSTIFNCLLEKFPKAEELPVYEVTETEKIGVQIARIVEKNTPKLNGLVLAGGKSTRMGTDKGMLSYFDIPQRDHTIRLLEEQGLDTYVSVRADQEIENHRTIQDTFVGLGPFGAICSAFMNNPNQAYLVLATDLPFVTKKTLGTLLSKRNPKKIATAIKGQGKQFMEPLVTIWEPKAYPILLQYLAQGYSCPRKILINSDVEIVEVADDCIQNINTPEEFQQAKKKLQDD
jgi:molybdopterin-guanine dinucleotide biosynthesis protein A